MVVSCCDVQGRLRKSCGSPLLFSLFYIIVYDGINDHLA